MSTMKRRYEVNPAKRYMQEYRGLLQRVTAVEAELARARENATRATSRLTAVRVSGTSRRDGVANAAVRMVDCERLLSDLAERLRAALAERLAIIERLSDEQYRVVCTMRYVNGATWDAIAEAMTYDVRWVHRLHGRALEEINGFLKHATLVHI